MAIKLIVGLGNPGPRYEQTRHNAGYWLVDQIARDSNIPFKPESRFFGEVCRVTLAGSELRLLKPQTFMNRSGQSVSSLARYFQITPQEMLVVHDELDLEPGVARLKQGGGHAGHNGLRDIICALGSRDFWRLRIGIDHPGQAKEVADFVLNRPSKAEQNLIDQAIDSSIRVLPEILREDFQKAMNQLHSS